jgi:lysophospholipase L1-like esterase
MDIGTTFLQPDGTLSKDIMPDLLHLSPKGYELWASAIKDKVADLMK